MGQEGFALLPVAPPPQASSCSVQGPAVTKQVDANDSALGCRSASDVRAQSDNSNARQSLCLPPLEEPWYLLSSQTNPGQHSEGEARSGGSPFCSPTTLPASEIAKEPWLLQRRNSGSLISGEPPSSSAWDSCGLYSLSEDGLLEAKLRDRSCVGPLSSSDSTGAWYSYSPVDVTERVIQEELADQHSGAGSPSCYCIRSPGGPFTSLDEGALPRKEDTWFPHLAGCSTPPFSEASISPLGMPASTSDEDCCTYAPPGDMEACESLGPCVAPAISWGSHHFRSEIGPLSAWYTMGRAQCPPRRSSEVYFLSLGAAAGRFSCPRALALGCCGTRHGSIGHARGAAALALCPHDAGLGNLPFPGASSSASRGASLHRCGGCCARQATALRNCGVPRAGGAGGFFFGQERGGSCCRRLLVRGSCRCLRRCSRIPRSAGSSILWGGGDCRELRGTHGDLPTIRCPCRGQQQHRPFPEGSGCCCAAPGDASQAITAARRGQEATHTNMCCASQYTGHGLQSQAPGSAPPFAARLRDECCRGPHMGLGSSPLLLPGLCSRRGGGQEAPAAGEGWPHRSLLVNCSPDLHDCFSRRRPSGSCTSNTTVSSSLSPSGCLGLGLSGSSAGASSQPTLSPAAPSPLLGLHAKTLARQQPAKGPAGETTVGNSRHGEDAGSAPATNVDSLMQFPLQEPEQQQQQVPQQQQHQGGEGHRYPCCCLVGDSCCYRCQRRATMCSSGTPLAGHQSASAAPHCGSGSAVGRQTAAVLGRSWPKCQPVRNRSAAALP